MTEKQQDHSDQLHMPSERFLISILKNNRAALLLLVMFLQILMAPLENNFSLVALIMREAIILAAIFMVADTRKHLTTALCIGIPALVLLLVSEFTETRITNIAAYIPLFLLYLYVIRLILNQVFRSAVVTVNTIAMALCCYMLIGQMWMLFYAAVAINDPAAFTQQIVQPGTDAGLTLTYFSYVTLTTLGYGDISPVSDWARSLAIMEALTGTMFMAVLISRLVGTYRSRSGRN